MHRVARAFGADTNTGHAATHPPEVRPLPRTYRAEAVIAAPPEQVWRVLVDFERYPEWNPFTPKLEAELTPGAPVVITVNLGGKQVVQREEMVEAVAPERLVWKTTYGGPLLLRAQRVQRLEPLEDGGTRYVSEDIMHGPLVPFVHLVHGRSLAEGFQAMADALAARCDNSP